MGRELVDARRRFRKVSLRLKIIDLRRSARWVLDRFQFGSGVAERLIAALIFAAIFFLGLLGVAATVGLPTSTGLILGGLALGTALVTSTVLVLGPADNNLIQERIALVEELDREAVRMAELKEEDAERQAEKSDRRSQRQADQPDRLAQREERRRRSCPFCGDRIQLWAMKCPNCHEYLSEELAREREEARQPEHNTGVAAVLSFLIPGLGQIYKGQILAGLVWFFVTQGTLAFSMLTLGCCVGFAGIPFAILLRILCIFDAASGGR